MLKFAMMILVLGAAVLSFSPWRAIRGDLTTVQGRVTEVNPASCSLTILDQSSSRPVSLRLNRDAFEPGQGWKNLSTQKEVEVVATSNLDGSLQARRIQTVQRVGLATARPAL